VIVKVDRLVKALTGGVVINDLQVFPYRSLFNIIFPSDLEDDLIYDGRVQLDR
jgi:hypothetical protein